MSHAPVARCRFCGYLYYTFKLPSHEAVCSSGPAGYIAPAGRKGMRIPLTSDEGRLLMALGRKPMPLDELQGAYGRKRLSTVLPDFLVTGLVEKNQAGAFALTEDGWKEALTYRAIAAVEGYLEHSSPEEFPGRMARVLSLIDFGEDSTLREAGRR